MLAAAGLLTACGDSSAPAVAPTRPIEAVTPVGVVVVAGGGQSVLVDQQFATKPSVRVTDASGKSIAGVSVTFSVNAGGGLLTGAVQTTDANGIATVGGVTAGPTPTSNEIIATAGSISTVIVVEATWHQTLSVGRNAACAIGSQGTTQCWGDNTWTQLGASSSELGISALGYATTPVAPASLARITSLVSVTGDVHCAQMATADWRCWGRDVGHTSVASAPITITPTSPPSQVDWAMLSPAITSVCGLSRTFTVFCWGENQTGEFGTFTGRAAGVGPSQTPIPADGAMHFARLVEGWVSTCGLTTDGTAYCWGDNVNGQLGFGVADSVHAAPQRVATAEKFVQLSVGAKYTCGITVAHKALCWGRNTHGMLGDGTTTDRSVPTAVAGNISFTSIQTNAATIPSNLPASTPSSAQGEYEHTCALTADGTAYCWGWNGAGQLGDGSQTDRLTPTLVSTDQRFTAIDLGDASTCATRGARVWCWGGNARGQVGDGTTTTRLTPVPVVIAP